MDDKPDDNLDDKHMFTEFCELCGTSFKHSFDKDQLQNKRGGLYSGVFLHKCKNNNEIHAILAYFDTDLANRGGDSAKVIQSRIFRSKVIQPSGISLEFLHEDAVPRSRKELSLAGEIQLFYEWFINEYISDFKTINLTERLVCPTLIKILEDLKSQSKLYENFVLISDETSDRIALDLKASESQTIKDSELRKIYQTFLDQIKTYFRKENENDALEVARKLGHKIITRWKELVQLGLSEDMFRILEDSYEVDKNSHIEDI